MDINKLVKIGLNTEDGLAYCADDEEFYGEMIGEYLSERDSRVKALTESFMAKDWDCYRILAHSIKSTSRMIGANELSEFAREMEQAAKDEDVEVLIAGHDHFLSEYVKLTDELAAAVEQK